MLPKILQGKVQARKQSPAAPTGQADQPKRRPRQEEALVELTDADLQAATGGGGRGGMGGDIPR